ncbi:MAG: hypothetical protein MJZ16_08975 [Bacteroidales bacterium]|nr:hypothetical protein [Bacteroidales bacterium]
MDNNQLLLLRQMNNRFAWIIADWVNDSSDSISEEVIRMADPERELPDEVLYQAIMLSSLNLNKEIEDYIYDYYLRESVRKLDILEYLSNPYLNTIKFPKVTLGEWEFTYLKYKPYEAFLRGDIILKEDLREIPTVGFFDKEYRYPAVLQKGREWMAVKPSEIESMKEPLSIVSGKIVTFGLGLGYFTFMASMKENVESITVVERDLDVIRLFEKHILPQFPDKGKIRIVRSDAFAYMDKTMPEEKFDYAFVDLWHDTSDGLSLYLRTKRRESLSPCTKFLYWVEESLLSSYRWTVFENVLKEEFSPDAIKKALSDEGLKKRLQH